MPNIDLTIQNEQKAAELLSAIFSAADEWKGTPYLSGGNSKQGIDCSHFVYQVFNAARAKTAPKDSSPQVLHYRNTSTIESSGLFIAVEMPKPGDLILWGGHVGIVVDAKTGTFIGAQTSTGEATAYYNSGYWATKAGKHFLRFVYLY